MKRRMTPLILFLLLTVTFCSLSEAESSAALSPGPAVQIIPPPAEQPEPEEAAEPPPEVHVIEECTVTWYTEDTCGKASDHPAYGITASGLQVEEGVTCAVDPEVIPLGAEIQVLFSDGTVGTFRATDTGVKGEWVDIYTPDYDYAIQCGLQRRKWIMTEKKTPRRCSRFRCAERKEYICCADCERRSLCLAACQNDPSWCGLEKQENSQKRLPRKTAVPK